jgi:hypothetical protein
MYFSGRNAHIFVLFIRIKIDSVKSGTLSDIQSCRILHWKTVLLFSWFRKQKKTSNIFSAKVQVSFLSQLFENRTLFKKNTNRFSGILE